LAFFTVFAGPFRLGFFAPMLAAVSDDEKRVVSLADWLGHYNKLGAVDFTILGSLEYAEYSPD